MTLMCRAAGGAHSVFPTTVRLSVTLTLENQHLAFLARLQRRHILVFAQVGERLLPCLYRANLADNTSNLGVPGSALLK